MTTIQRPNLAHELSRLKDFQRDTVEHVFARMYEHEAPARRFLVADEVGLGKTMVARGLVAKVIDRLWDAVGRIDIVYICSNGSIARQNINRLNVSDAKDATLPSRITLLPTVVKGLKDRKLNFISLTPQTSFDLRSSLGRFEERALLYWLLPDDWKINEAAAQNILQGEAGRETFRRRVSEFAREHIDDDLRTAFHRQLENRHDLRDTFMSSAERFQIARQNVPDQDRVVQRDIVGTLRQELAISCLSALEPDLIILDEFQRFKHLLDGTDHAGDLARKLFDFGDTRVLLLSATPYKMYTLSEEAESDDHFRDFLQTVSFLQHDETRTAQFRTNLEQYRNSIFSISNREARDLVLVKAPVEKQLRELMVRTERLAASEDRNGMLVEVAADRVALESQDVDSFLGLARLAAVLEHPDVTEYWKSAPYLLNFMDDYEFKTAFTESAGDREGAEDLSRTLSTAEHQLLDWDDIERYRPLDPANARLRGAILELREKEAWRLLWLPPSLPYHELAGAYAGREGRDLTKHLIFSSWQVVPKVVSAVLSYEAERLMFGDRPDVDRPNSTEARDRFRPLLRFARKDGGLTAMALLSLMYPSVRLAEVGDPLEIRRAFTENGQLSLDQVLQVIEKRIRTELETLAVSRADGGADASWYWAAPVLLDLARYPVETKKWLDQTNLAELWRDADGETTEEDEGSVDAWGAHVTAFIGAATGRVRLGPQPGDLPEVIAKIALAGPAVVALRALSRLGNGAEVVHGMATRNQAGWIAWAFRSLFNLPEVTAMLRRDEGEESYWQRVLEYCAAGSLQSVMDEYVHVLNESEGVGHKPINHATRAIAKRIVQSLRLRTATVRLDEIGVSDGRVTTQDRRMRSRYAARFGARQTDEGAGAVRADDVRSAFNSPFWPFVLCSTSVGQEGLDFHHYSHAVVHWNLPSNPVDLEQREGRIHRYKGHAVRKNAAMLHGEAAVVSDSPDPWTRVFELAKGARDENASDLSPYWILVAPNGARIERHIPALPLSRDVARAAMLRKALTVYRMAFGQNRQDDIIAYLSARFAPEEIQRLACEMRIDLAPRRVRRPDPGEVHLGRPAALDESDEISTSYFRKSHVTLDAAEALLSEYSRIHISETRPGLERYQDLLDRFVSLRG